MKRNEKLREAALDLLHHLRVNKHARIFEQPKKIAQQIIHPKPIHIQTANTDLEMNIYVTVAVIGFAFLIAFWWVEIWEFIFSLS
jgi:hypothetical protein